MKTALFLGAGASAFAGQPTTKVIMDHVRERVRERAKELHRDMNRQNYIMSVVGDQTYSDVEKLYDGIEQMININKNPNCKPITGAMNGPYNVNHAQIIEELTDLRSIIRDVLLESFELDRRYHEPIRRMYDMVRSAIEFGGTDEFFVFTTNYDMVMETCADMSGLEVTNGFTHGGHLRRVWADMWDRSTDRPPLYLMKLHGSINWHREEGGKIVETGSITQRDADSDILIAPTEGVKDYGMKPFDTLLNRFSNEISGIDMLLVIGFSYRDAEIAKIIMDGVRNGMTLISISPDATSDIRRVSAAHIKTVEYDGQIFKTAGARIILLEQKFGPKTIDDMRASLEAAYKLLFLDIHARGASRLGHRDSRRHKMD